MSHAGGFTRSPPVVRSCHRGKSGGVPGSEAADDVGCAPEAEVDQRGSCENGGAAVVAKEHDPVVEAADVRVATRAVQFEAPLEHGARDMERTRNDPVALSVDVCANVDQKGTLLNCGECIGRLEPLDPRSGRVEQLFERSALLAGRHEWIIRSPLPPV